MRILICDDDLSITQSLSQIIKTYFNKKKVNNLDIITFNDGDSLLSDKSQKDIVFLDVEMPGFDGIYVGNELKKQNESVIIFIVTSYLEYLDAAMRFHVFRYLSKPIDKQRLFQNLDDALELYYSINQKIAVETKYGVTSVLTCDIVLGKGLMQGLVCTLPVGQVSAKALEQGLIVITAGADVLRFVPPLVIEKQHVDEMIEKLEKALLAVKEA